MDIASGKVNPKSGMTLSGAATKKKERGNMNLGPKSSPLIADGA
jgi:hypothetical protein